MSDIWLYILFLVNVVNFENQFLAQRIWCDECILTNWIDLPVTFSPIWVFTANYTSLKQMLLGVELRFHISDLVYQCFDVEIMLCFCYADVLWENTQTWQSFVYQWSLWATSWAAIFVDFTPTRTNRLIFLLCLMLAVSNY